MKMLIRVFVVVIVLMTVLATANADEELLAENPGSSIGYPTVLAALQALRTQPRVRITVQQGWTVADDRASLTIWSFAPEGNPAYPAVVKREMLEKDGGVYIRMNVLCQSTKSACDQLVRDFQNLNAHVREILQHKVQPGVQADVHEKP